MRARKGKTFFEKSDLDRPEVRKIVWDDTLRHVRAGFSIESCKYGKGIFENLLKMGLTEYSEAEFEQSVREGMRFWEGVGRDQALGSCLGNSRAWAFNMCHRYGWSDRQKVDVTHGGQVSVNVVSFGIHDKGDGS